MEWSRGNRVGHCVISGDRSDLLTNLRDELVPTLIETIAAFDLQLRSNLVEIDACSGDRAERRFSSDTISRHRTLRIARLRKIKQRFFRHSVNGVGSTENIDIQGLRKCWIFRTC